MKKILKKLIKSFVLKKIYEYKMRRKYGSLYDLKYDDGYYHEDEYEKPKYFRSKKKKKKKKKSYKYMLEKILD